MRRIAAAMMLAFAAPAAAADLARLDRTLEAAGFQGVALLGAGDDIAWSRAAGEAQPGVPHRIESVWRLASVTKQLTALIVMQEVAAGRLDLDVAVKTYWPEWPAVYADKITIRMLLQHLSGLADPNESASSANDTVPDFYRHSGAAAAPMASATGFCAARPRTAAGAGYHYNNCDYLVLGALLEHMAGKPFAALLAERIAAPLGLVATGMFDPTTQGPRDVPGLLADGKPEPALNLGIYGAAGSGYSTAEELWRFDRALMSNRLLDKVATATMWTGDPAIGYDALGAWSFTAPLKGCPDPVAIVERRGAIGGVQVRNFLLPATRTALILFTNRENFDFGEVWQGRGFSHDMLAAALCPETK